MYNSNLAIRQQSKISSSKQFRNLFSPFDKQAPNQPSIQQYLQTQNDTKIQSFKQSLNMLPDIQTIEFEDNSRYYGQIVQDSIRHGIGIFQTQEGDIYMGDWQNDTYHGYGMYVYHEGQRYQGELVEGMKEGEGKYFYLDGKVYEGMWVGDQRQGVGEEKDSVMGICYQGEWLDDQKHGKGKICLLNPTDWGLPASQTTLMQGTWVKDKFSCGLIQTQLYKGQFQNQTLTGQGSYKFPDGSMYQGTLINNLMQGHGTYYYSNGDVYQGEFFCGLKHGKGVYRYFTGDVYTGGYEKDIKSGEGRFAFVNGNYYVGEFERDCFHGKGKYFFTKEEAIEGWWENGKLVKNEKGQEIGDNRKMALMRQKQQKGDRTPRNDRSRSPIISRSPMNRSPIINSFSNPNIQTTRNVSPFNLQRNNPIRQQKAGMILINPSRSPISKSKFMQVHTPGDSYFKSASNREFASTNKKPDSSIKNNNTEIRSNIKLIEQEIQEEGRESDKRLFDMLNDGEKELERRERERQVMERNGEGVKSEKKIETVQMTSQQVKKISKRFQK